MSVRNGSDLYRMHTIFRVAGYARESEEDPAAFGAFYFLASLGAPVPSAAEHAVLGQVKAGPRDGEQWTARIKEEYQALIKYVQAW